MSENNIQPWGCISPNVLISTEINRILDNVFNKGLVVLKDELKDIQYYEEGQKVEFSFLPLKKMANVMKFSWRSSSIEFNTGRTELSRLVREYELMKIYLSRRIANYIDERIVKFGESCEAILFSCPIKPESGRLYKGHHVYFASEFVREHWDCNFQIDLFLTPVIYPRYWEDQRSDK